MAAINLFSVLRNLEDLTILDDKAKTIIASVDYAVKFSIPKMDDMTLLFKDGRCTAIRKGGASCDMHLRFLNAKHFNKMIDGNGIPIPTKGVRNLSFLKKEFTALTDRLEKLLRPTDEQLKDESFRKTSTILTAYTAFYAVPEVARYDEVGKYLAKNMQNGTVAIVVGDETMVSLVIHGGELKTIKGEHGNVRAKMTFDSLDTAEGVLRGTVDTYACIGKGQLAISGHIPTIDYMNKLLNLVSRYLE